MPKYDYICENCRKRFDVTISYADYGRVTVTCKYCGSSQVKRRIGRVRIMRSGESRLEDFSDEDALEGLEENPKALGKMMRKMSEELGEDMGPEFHEVVSRLEAGHSPEDIEKELPDLGIGDTSDGGEDGISEG